jgi:isocitrate dehydrogenase (NAD+)
MTGFPIPFMSYTITLIEGDGIGPEIVAAALRVLDATGVPLRYERRMAGAGAEARYGHTLPRDTVDSLSTNCVGLKGPLIVPRGSPPVRVESLGKTFATPNAALRGVCRAFANVRPAKRFDGVPGRYRDLAIDLVLVREVSEGIYIARESEPAPGRAEAVLLTTEHASERIARFAFELARREHRRRVTAVHKANVLDRTDGLFLRTFERVAADYATTGHDDLMVDAAAARMVLDPAAYDVIVAPNQYGDILSDLAAAVVGGLGLGPGANYGERAALFEACHGAAPDIAGTGIANPIAVILSGAMMLEHLGEHAAARQVRTAVEEFLRRGEGFTPDLGGTGTTSGVAERIVRRMEEGAR